MPHDDNDFGCGYDRRDVLAATAASLGGLTVTALSSQAAGSVPPPASEAGTRGFGNRL